MPLIYQHQINETSRLGVWHIAEPEEFFLEKVPVQRNITHPHKRLQHLAGRYLLLELEPSFPFDLIKIADTKKPYLEDEAFHFSISHCSDYAAVIISSNKRVGVDIELVTDKVVSIIPKFLTTEEGFLLPRGALAKTATLFWSTKESIYKWYGHGKVDFKEHIRIHDFIEKDEEGIVSCSFLKSGPVTLKPNFLFFNGNCLSWVLSEV